MLVVAPDHEVKMDNPDRVVTLEPQVLREIRVRLDQLETPAHQVHLVLQGFKAHQGLRDFKVILDLLDNKASLVIRDQLDQRDKLEIRVAPELLDLQALQEI